MAVERSMAKRPNWSSGFAFIMATLGSAVGLGNIWRFPYVMGQNGGALFLLMYILLTIFICSVPLLCELLLGKQMRRGVIRSYEKINKKFSIFGWLCFATSIFIPCFYFVVCGWTVNYIFIYLFGTIPVNEISQATFDTFAAQPVAPLIMGIIFLFLCAIFPFRGVNKGIEQANNIIMPLFIIMLFFLAITGLFLDNSIEGLKFMFQPNVENFTFKTVLTALGQALFTLSVGMGCLVTYGSYLKKDSDIIKSSTLLIIGNTIIAVLAGIMIFPAVFSFNLEPSAGAGLVFITLPKVFAALPFGQFFGLMFFVLLFFAALTSGISLLEVSIAAILEKFKISRKIATVIMSSIILIFMVPTTWSFGPLAGYKLFNMTFFEIMDFTASNILLPLNTIILCVVVGWILKPKMELLTTNKKFYNVFTFLLKFIVPPVLILLMLFGLGLV